MTEIHRDEFDTYVHQTVTDLVDNETGDNLGEGRLEESILDTIASKFQGRSEYGLRF
jgi:hypothetical protein